jgi:hypothetical protein
MMLGSLTIVLSSTNRIEFAAELRYFITSLFNFLIWTRQIAKSHKPFVITEILAASLPLVVIKVPAVA